MLSIQLKLWQLATYLAAGAIILLLVWYMGVLPGLAALAILLLDRLPGWKSWFVERSEIRRLREVAEEIARECIKTTRRDFPFIRQGPSLKSLVSLGEQYGFLDSELALRIAQQMVERAEQSEIGAVPSSVIAQVVLERARPSTKGEAKNLIRESVVKFLRNEIAVKANGVKFTVDGDSFIRLLHALESGPLSNEAGVKNVLEAPLDDDARDGLAFSILDPRLFYLIANLGKGSALEDLISRAASGRRILSFLRRKGRPKRVHGDHQYYVLLKQEYRQGRMNIKERIASFPDRITATGWMYSDGGMKAGYQSISIVPSPVKYASAAQFLAKHFPVFNNLTPEERSRASIVAIPLDMDKACALPKTPSRTLDASHLSFQHNWLDFFRIERVSKRRDAEDFDLTISEIMTRLSIDFLIKNPTPGEIEFFRANTDRILRRLGLKSIFELHKISTASLIRAAKETGVPSYWAIDIERTSDDTSVPFVRWLDNRLFRILTEATKTTSLMNSLLAKPHT